MTEHNRAELRVAEEPALYLLATRMKGLSDDAWSALGQLPVLHRFVGRGAPLIGEGARVDHVGIICKGWALRYSTLDRDRRHIQDVLLPGDIVGLISDGSGRATSRVDALTPCEVGEVDLRALNTLARTHAGVAMGLSRHLARELVRAEDHALRLSRMTAYERVCGFLLDLHHRQQEGLSARKTVDCPITQTLVADVLGLSVVHVNRQIMQLRREGVVTLTRRSLTVHDESWLAEASGYRDRHFADPGGMMFQVS